MKYGRNLKDDLRCFLADGLKALGFNIQDVGVDMPKDNKFGDFSTNAALKLASCAKQAPAAVAQRLVSQLKKTLPNSHLREDIEDIKADGGFVNFYLRRGYFYKQLQETINKDKDFGRQSLGNKKRVLMEFVSANPTGSLSVAHARQAVVADVLANVLDFLGFVVKREYYLNDEGNQIDILGRSIELRLRQLTGEKIDFPCDHYQGDYIYDIAKKIKNQKSSPFAKPWWDSPGRLKARRIDGERTHPTSLNGRPEPAEGSSRTVKILSEYGLKYILKIIKKELDDFGIRFDYWYSQKKLRKSGKIKKALDRIKGALYQKDGAIWLCSTKCGDDKDRVVIKSDGNYTYLAADIAYHWDKYKRQFDWLINFWGPDHHGYINRLKAAVGALGYPAGSLSIIIVQLASIYRQGRPVEMSTRKGQYITLREVLDEVGRDAARFFFLMRRTDSHLDFDLELAKRQTPENPVYYVQYAHARITNILKNAAGLNYKKADLYLLREEEELALLKKLSQFPYVLGVILNTLDPNGITVYLQNLAADFHRFYDRHRVLGVGRQLSLSRLALAEGVRIVLAKGLHLMGIKAPKKM